MGFWVAAAPYIASAAASIGSSLLSKKKKTSQVPLEPEEVTQARRKLMDFANTGTFGNFTAGAEVPLGYGDYEATDIEKGGLSNLRGLLDSGAPDQFNMGDQALQDLLATSPGMIEKQFSPFQAQVQRQIKESDRDLKRNAAFARNLYSTDTIRGLGDIRARGNETLTSQLAALTNEALNRKERAIPLAYQAGQARENIAMGRIEASQQYGGLIRQLNDAKIKARDQELLRRRAELQLPIDAAKAAAGVSANYGVPEVESNPMNDLLGMVGQIGGQYLGNELFMKQYQRNNATAAVQR